MSSNVANNGNEDNGNGDARLMNINRASEYLDTSRNTTWRVIKQYKVKTFENPLDMRETLVRQEDLERIKSLLRPKKSKRKENDMQSKTRRQKA